MTDLGGRPLAVIATVTAAAGMACYVGGRTLFDGALLDVAVAGTYLVFTGTLFIAALLVFLATSRPPAAQVSAFALVLFGAILVAQPFNRDAAPLMFALGATAVVAGLLVSRDLAHLSFRSRDSQSTGTLRLRWSAAWIPAAALVAAYVAFGDFSPRSTYVMQLVAIGAVLVSVAGRNDRRAAAGAAAVMAAGAGYVIALVVPRIAAGDPHLSAYLIAALTVIGLSTAQLWRLATRRDVVDPVYLIAAQLAVALALRWAYYLGSGRGLDPSTYGVGSATSPFHAELPLLALGLAAIGLGLSRPLVPAVRRLGLGAPRWWHVVLALAIADGYLTLTFPAQLLTYQLDPSAYYRIQEIFQKADASLPAWSLLAYGVLAGICEETLFRGALQPRVGILATAVLFATIHIQYGLTPALGLVFTAGIVYGLLRKHINLTTAIMAHAATDTGGFPFGPWPVTALWIAILLAVVIAAVARRHRSRRDTVPREPGADLGDHGVRTVEDIGGGETK